MEACVSTFAMLLGLESLLIFTSLREALLVSLLVLVAPLTPANLAEAWLSLLGHAAAAANSCLLSQHF